MRSNSLDSKLKAKEVELKRHEQEIADQDEVWFMCLELMSAKHNTSKILSLQKVLYKLLKLWLATKWSSVTSFNKLLCDVLVDSVDKLCYTIPFQKFEKQTIELLAFLKLFTCQNG